MTSTNGRMRAITVRITDAGGLAPWRATFMVAGRAFGIIAGYGDTPGRACASLFENAFISSGEVNRADVTEEVADGPS